MNEHITAIDIGTTKIVAIVGKTDSKGRVKIIGVGTEPTPSESVKRGVVLNIEETSKAIKSAVERAEEASGVTFKNAIVGIAGQHIKSHKTSHSTVIPNGRVIEPSDVEKLRDDMYRTALEPGEEIIHVIPQNYMVDKETGVKRPIGMYAKKLVGNYHIIIGEVNSVKNIERCFDKLGIEISALFLEPLASASAVLTEDEKEAGVALVDIGGGTTDIAVYYDGILRHTAVIPFGGNVITSDVKTGCSILSKHAETVKIQHGKALSDFAPKNQVVAVPGISGRDKKQVSLKMVAEIIQARMEEIIKVINFHLKNSGYSNKLGAGISLTGGGSLLQYVNQLMKYKTGLDVKLSVPGAYLAPESIKLNNPKFSTAVGLVKLGLEMKKREDEKVVVKEKEVVESVENQEETVKEEKAPKRRNAFVKFKEIFADYFVEK